MLSNQLSRLLQLKIAMSSKIDKIYFLVANHTHSSYLKYKRSIYKIKSTRGRDIVEYDYSDYKLLTTKREL